LTEDDTHERSDIVYPRLGVAVVRAPLQTINKFSPASPEFNNPIIAIEPEKIRTDLQKSNGADGLLQSEQEELIASKFDQSEATWGLRITNVVKSDAGSSEFSGRGIKVAVLDGGLDLEVNEDGDICFHPDFAGRTIISKTFVPGTTNVKDTRGHGTHCLGIACGPLLPSLVPRYGIAYEADIYVAKVLDEKGEGPDRRIIAGIEWALENGCNIISMSIASSTKPDQPFNTAYEHIAQRCLAKGLLIIAAAGNDSLRPIRVSPVGEPANCPSIMAVAGINPQLNIVHSSNGGVSSGGGEIDIAAPGIGVLSSGLQGAHETNSGTSVAAPHVAGIAALYLGANPGVSGRQLWELIVENAFPLMLSRHDAGAGLVHTP
jgi:subtilisin